MRPTTRHVASARLCRRHLARMRTFVPPDNPTNGLVGRGCGLHDAEMRVPEESSLVLPPAKETPTSGVQLSFAVDDVTRAAEVAVEHGARLLHALRVEPWGTSARLTDFDGNVIELTQRPSRTECRLRRRPLPMPARSHLRDGFQARGATESAPYVGSGGAGSRHPRYWVGMADRVRASQQGGTRAS